MTGYWDTSCLYFRTGRKGTCCGDASGFRHLSEMVPPVAYCSSEPLVTQGKFVRFFRKFCTLSLSELNFTHWGFCDSKPLRYICFYKLDADSNDISEYFCK